MLYSTGTSDCSGSPVLPGVLSEAAASQWSHTVPAQMPWTIPASQRPFSCGGDTSSVAPFLPQQATAASNRPARVPASTPAQIATPSISPALAVSPAAMMSNGFEFDKMLAGHGLGRELSALPQTRSLTVETNAIERSCQTTTLFVPELSAICLPKIPPPGQNQSSSQFVVYPGDPCSSSAPQIPRILTGEPSMSGPSVQRSGLNSQNVPRQPFPSTSYCAPRFKRKLRVGTCTSDSGTMPPSDESEAVRGKIFVTEQMVNRMGDLSLDDQRLKEDFEPTSLNALTAAVETGTMTTGTYIHSNRNSNKGHGNNNSRDKVSFCGNSSKQMSIEDELDDCTSADSRGESTTNEATLRICTGLKPSTSAASSIEERLAMDMIKKTTMAVAIWQPLKIPPLIQTEPAASTSSASSAADIGNTEMDEQDSDRSVEGKTSMSMSDDVMEVM